MITLRRTILSIVLGLSAGPLVRAGQDDHALPPAAGELLHGCIDALPDIPLLITGELVGRTHDGDQDRRLGVEMLLDWQADPPTARYTIRDNFGAALSHLSVTWPKNQDVEYRFFTGEPLVAAPLPVLSAPIPGTDISWIDLSLAFLWWEGGRIEGAESVRGRACWVLDLPAPPDQAPCAAVRLWIDPQIHIMLKAESYDGATNLMRRLEVKSFKKINDRWVIKDIEIEGYPSKHKTYLRIQNVQDRTRKQYVPANEGGPATGATDNVYESVESAAQEPSQAP